MCVRRKVRGGRCEEVRGERGWGQGERRGSHVQSVIKNLGSGHVNPEQLHRGRAGGGGEHSMSSC